MEEMHRIHKEVPYGYWVLWIVPAWRYLTRKRRERRERAIPEPLKTLYEHMIALR